MKIQSELLVIFIHLLLAMSVSLLILFGKTYLRREHIFFIFFLPIFGVFSAIIIELMNILGKQGQKPVDLEPLNLEDDILWKTLKNSREKGDLIPLEEAILINETKVRRRFMLETLYSDPYKYLDILNIAKFNDDVETSHYATTTISKAQKDFQLSIQKLATQVENQPENLTALDSYIEVLGKYIKSGLLEEHLLKNLRIVYSTILDKKLNKIGVDKKTIIEKLRNSVDLKDYAAALESSKLLKKNYPYDEEAWIEVLRVCVERDDSSALLEALNEIRLGDISWTKQGKDQVSPWIKVAVK